MSKQLTRAGFLRATRALFVPVAGMVLALGSSGLSAGGNPPLPYSVTEVFIELNNSDQDLGLHSLIDGQAWKKLEIIDPKGKRVLKTRLSGKLAKQGLTEFFFESAEPTFEELSPEQFFARFPQGSYTVRGRSLEGERMKGVTTFTHAVPAPANTHLNGMTDTATECDEDEGDYDPLLLERPVTISWDPVTSSHPDLGGLPVVPVSIRNYELVVEIELEVDGEEFDSKLSVILPADQTSMTLPDGFIEQAEGHVKYEVLAREASFNQTAVESCFEVDDEDEDEDEDDDQG